MEDEFWIQGRADTGPPVLYTKNHVIAVIKRINNQHPLEAVEPKISKTFENVHVLHEARNTLYNYVTHYRGAMKDVHGVIPTTRRCSKLAIRDIMMMLEDSTEKLIVFPLVEWKDLDIVYHLCKGTDVSIEEETRVGGTLSFKVQDMEKHLTALTRSMDTFRQEAERRWNLEESRRRDKAVEDGEAGGGGAGARPSFSRVVGGYAARPGLQIERGGRRLSIPGLHLNGAPTGAQQMGADLEEQEGGLGVAGWEEVNGNGRRRRARARSPQVKRSAEAMDKGKTKSRPQAKFGTRVVEMEGAEAAPVSFFIGNTNSKSVKENISKVIMQCAKQTNVNDLQEEDMKIDCVTKVENPRTLCWKLTVPNKYRETFRDDSFWPLGWSHRPWGNRGPGNIKVTTKKPRTESQVENEIDEVTPEAAVTEGTQQTSM